MNRYFVAAFIFQVPEKRPEDKRRFEVGTGFLPVEWPEKENVVVNEPLVFSPAEDGIRRIDPERVFPFEVMGIGEERPDRGPGFRGTDSAVSVKRPEKISVAGRFGGEILLAAVKRPENGTVFPFAFITILYALCVAMPVRDSPFGCRSTKARAFLLNPHALLLGHSFHRAKRVLCWC